MVNVINVVRRLIASLPFPGGRPYAIQQPTAEVLEQVCLDHPSLARRVNCEIERDATFHSYDSLAELWRFGGKIKP